MVFVAFFLLSIFQVADRRGVGVWERDTWVESVQSVPSQVTGYVRAAAITKFAVGSTISNIKY